MSRNGAATRARGAVEQGNEPVRARRLDARAQGIPGVRQELNLGLGGQSGPHSWPC